MDSPRAAAQIAKTEEVPEQAQGQAQGGGEDMEWTLMIICSPRVRKVKTEALLKKWHGKEDVGKSAVEVTIRFFQVAALARRHQGWRITH